MKLKEKNLFDSVIKHYKISILILAAITWFPVLFVSFINDDIQILGYFRGNSIETIFQPFFTPDVSNYYWRPVGNMLHPLIMIIGGFNPFLFRLISLLSYILCIILIVKASEQIGVEKKTGFIFAIFFAALPSHELQIAWIADQGESLLTIFLLLSFISYSKIYWEKEKIRKNSISAAAWFLLAVLVKETAYAGIFIPFIVMISQNDYNRKRIFKTFRDSGIGVLIVSLTLIYRYIFIGGSPFNSDNFSNFSIVNSIINFFIYIPLAFVPPETLEWLQSVSGSHIILILILVICLFVLIYFILKAFQLNKLNRTILITGIAWYVVFIIPALSKLMRWYVFTASIGLIWVLSSFFQNRINFFAAKKIKVVLFLLIAGMTVYDFSLMTRWVDAGSEFNTAIESFGKYKNEIGTDSILVWVAPDKINRIPVMKLGLQQSVQFEIKNDSLDVSAPFRAEMINDKSSIELVSCSDSSVIFKIFNGRFLPDGGKSRYIIKDEILDGKIEGMNYNINTSADRKIPQSVLTVTNIKQMESKDQFYFDGKEFIKIKK